MGKIKSEDADARFGQCLEFFPLYSMPVRWLRQFLFSCSIPLRRLLVDEFGNWLHFSRRNNQFFSQLCQAGCPDSRKTLPEILIAKSFQQPKSRLAACRGEQAYGRQAQTVEGCRLDHAVNGHVRKGQLLANSQRGLERIHANVVTGQSRILPPSR